MSKIRLDDLKAALEKRQSAGGSELKESDYKRKLVSEINRLPGGRARRIEDRFAVGVLDMILKPPDLPLVLGEGKVIDGFQFAPTQAQFEEGKRWQEAGVECILIGWKARQMFVSPWVEKADCRQCFTIQNIPYSQVLLEYLR